MHIIQWCSKGHEPNLYPILQGFSNMSIRVTRRAPPKRFKFNRLGTGLVVCFCSKFIGDTDASDLGNIGVFFHLFAEAPTLL